MLVHGDFSTGVVQQPKSMCAPLEIDNQRTTYNQFMKSRIRGGGKLQRHLSHHDIKPVLHGTPDTCDARVYAKNVNGGDYFSLWHDLPLFELSTADGKPTGALNFVCEITKGTRKKFEIATSEPFNPIKQDEDHVEGRLRSFKKGDIYFNWGCFPRCCATLSFFSRSHCHRPQFPARRAADSEKEFPCAAPTGPQRAVVLIGGGQLFSFEGDQRSGSDRRIRPLTSNRAT